MLFGLIMAVFLGMQSFMKRGIQNVVKVAADGIGNQRNGSVQIGRSDELRTLPPGVPAQKIITTQSSEALILELAEEGKAYYQRDANTTLEKDGSGQQKPQPMHHEYRYYER